MKCKAKRTCVYLSPDIGYEKENFNLNFDEDISFSFFNILINHFAFYIQPQSKPQPYPHLRNANKR